jgi:hypothetical protein
VQKRGEENSRKWAEVSTLNCSISPNPGCFIQPPNQAWVIYFDSLCLQTFSFDRRTNPPSCIYQSDLAALYAILVEKILQEEKEDYERREGLLLRNPLLFRLGR